MQKNYNENLVAGAAIRDDKGRRISKLFELPHPKMTVGYAKNLIMPNDPTEQKFNFRQAGGGVIEDGVAVIDKVKGNSVVWNQLWRKEWASTATQSGITLTNNGDGSYTANGTANGDIDFYAFIVPVIGGHKYLIKGCPQGGGTNTYSFRLSSIGYDYGEGKIGTNSQTQNIAYEFHFTNGVTCSNLVFRPQIIDLTQMFGVGNEPSTYKEFLQRKPKVTDEYTYNEGTIVNNKVEAVVTTGRNLCPYLEQGTLNIYNGSEQPNTTRVRTPFIPISNKHSYCTMLNKWAIRNGCFYDRNKNFISSGYPSVSTGVLDSSNIPANAAFLRLIYSAQNGTDVVTSSYDVFMFAIGNTTIPTTEYEPYEEHELDLSWVKDIKSVEGVKLFEDGLKSAGTAFDEAAKGKAIKRIGVVDLGELEWRTNTSPTEENGMMCRFFVKLTGLALKPNFSNCVLSPKFSYTYDLNINTSYNHTCFSYADGRVFFNIAVAEVGEYSKDAIRNYMQGVPLYYELAEPIEVEYDEKNLTYPVVAGGTEKAIASEPSTVFLADIGYGIDAVKTILDLKARVEALEGK